MVQKLEEEMKTFPPAVFIPIPYLAIILLLTAACGGPPAAAPVTPTFPPGDLSGLSADQIATLASLEKVAEYPFYVMHYSGAYDFPQTGMDWPAEHDFACSLFAAMAQPGDRLYGRNFDWDFSPALLLFTDPPDGYASVAMVDLTFLDISPESAKSLTGLPLKERTALLSAPAMPFDGMNETGLAIAMAAVPETGTNNAGNDPSKPAIGSIGIIREVLDHARTVDEAVDRFEQFNINFGGGPPIHYLIADASGKAVLVELYQGELVVLPNEDPWHLATNHYRCNASGDGGCPRYHTLAERLTETNGRLDEKGAMQLLADVAQDGTQWSVVYNMTDGGVSVVIGQDDKMVYPFQLGRR